MIRAATHGDLDALIEIGRACHAESPHYGRYPYKETRLRALLANVLESGDATILVAEKDSRIVGVLVAMVGAYFFTSARYATDLVFYVLPDVRGGPYAKRLVDAFERWAHDQGADEIAPGVSSGLASERTRGFFRALGYEELGYIMVKYL